MGAGWHHVEKATHLRVVSEVSMNDEQDDELLTYTQAGRLLNLRTNTLYSLVSRSQIPHLRLGPRIVRFSRAALELWMREGEVPVRRGGR